jgi:hypothetical protein
MIPELGMNARLPCAGFIQLAGWPGLLFNPTCSWIILASCLPAVPSHYFSY